MEKEPCENVFWTGGPCTHEYTAAAVYRKTGQKVGEVLVRKKKGTRRSQVGAGVPGGEHNHNTLYCPVILSNTQK